MLRIGRVGLLLLLMPALVGAERIAPRQRAILLKNLTLPSSQKEEDAILELASAHGMIACYRKLYPKGNEDVLPDMGMSNEIGIQASDACRHFIELLRRAVLK